MPSSAPSKVGYAVQVHEFQSVILSTHKPTDIVNMDDDPFDDLLNLEDQYYREGYDLGVKDGSRAGLIEGRLFGIEKGFEKYAAMGRLHGQAIVWAGRMPTSPIEDEAARQHPHEEHMTKLPSDTDIETPGSKLNDKQAISSSALPDLPATVRLEKHIRTLYALAEPSSLSTQNDEESVSQFDDRLKRAEGKVKIIEKLIGEVSRSSSTATDLPSISPAPTNGHTNKGESSIEDVSILHARH
jgi:hypothetical protein